MVLDDYIKSVASEVNAELLKFFPRRFSKEWCESALGSIEFEVDSEASQNALFEPIWDFLDRGGKRWRPALALLACEAVGGKRSDAIPYCIIPELVHNGTIMVDDVEDNSVLRRGKPSTHILYGVDVAVNAGNAMYYIPLVLLFGPGLSDKKKLEIYNLYAKYMLRLSFGQAFDIYWHRGKGVVSEKKYLQMCVFKTGSLAAFSAGLGGILGNGSKKQVEGLIKFAESVGGAFQIQDDILNIKPESLEWGKEIGDDIKEGKRTLMVVHALSVLSKSDKAKLLKIINSNEKSESDVVHAIKLLEKSGSIDYARDYARKIVADSWGSLEVLLPDSKAKFLLKDFADYLVKRNI